MPPEKSAVQQMHERMDALEAQIKSMSASIKRLIDGLSEEFGEDLFEDEK